MAAGYQPVLLDYSKVRYSEVLQAKITDQFSVLR